MDTPTSWVGVILTAMAYGGGMLLWTTHKRKAANIKPACSCADALFWGFAGFPLGLMTIYHWQAFHRPLIYLTILGFVGALIANRFGPAAQKQLH
jgi:hypothetical protein